ncbi:cellulase family glycosylhydrolase [Actinophytocola sp.]|uniref:cellulase family glycosylhydrolase n=1 Tax=Actinophytocola sp. TaxID=1872138 RepID=UPI00389A73F2
MANVVSLCKQNRLICVLEAHDTTGYGEDRAAASLDQAVSYWISQKSALVGQENYVVINIGNEPIGNKGAAAGHR